MADGERTMAFGASEGEARTAGPAGPVASSVEPLSAQEKRRLLAQLILQHKGEPRRFPASFAQQRLWFLDQVAAGKPRSTTSTSRSASRCRSRCDVLRGRSNEIVRRHDSLRTTFHDDRRRSPYRSSRRALALPAAGRSTCRDLPDAERDAEAVRLRRPKKRGGRSISRAARSCATTLLRLRAEAMHVLPPDDAPHRLRRLVDARVRRGS